ncbi:MAG: S8 family serine peptidase, partial [Candidatus Lokiarchaeota archaeon]|nr:S8 family serine peptidase [Candidatus Lokiarchaeota archaeon]
ILNQSGVGYTSDLITAFASVIQNRSKYHIVSVCLSVGTLGEDIEAVNSVINEVIEEGILVVIAAGNTGIETSDPLNKLAENKNAIVVGAINDIDQVTSYSSMGKEIESIIKPDIVAPGGSKIPNHRSVIAADKEVDKATPSYGTSIATAIVSASINLLIEARWNAWNNLNLTEWVKPLKAFLLMTASETNLEREDDPVTTVDESDYSPSLSLAPLTTGLKDIHEGYGRLN